ncbi:MAG: CehA/McbA family metallohydrolase [Planctomyces sp.]|nr:CehA/McbA family metallohydrolase [Planctomyces sp.]
MSPATVLRCGLLVVVLVTCGGAASVEDEVVPVAGQPLAANVERVLRTLDLLGAPLSADGPIRESVDARDAAEIQRRLDPHVLLHVHINPEHRVKVRRGDGPAVLQQWGAVPVLVKVANEGAVARSLRISSPQAGPIYAGESEFILGRQAQTELRGGAPDQNLADRFLDVSIHTAPPMTERLSGLEVEYVIAMLSSSESGAREATIAFDVGQGTQDLEFRAEAPVLFQIEPARAVRIHVRDEQGRPTMARLSIRDGQGRVFPSQSKRLAPDFFFQPHIYRFDGETILLPDGEYFVEAGRGPEYRVLRSTRHARDGEREWTFALERWLDPAEWGWYSGDHHIHGAGCSHYASPTEGVAPGDMFRQVQGEALNVGCVLTWGPCFDFQRRYFSATADELSEPFTVLKYDLEISGFGSQALGHVCLLNLKDQVYPGTDGTSLRWPTWTVPVLKWARDQGGVTGYPHSSLRTEPGPAGKRLFESLDANRDGIVSRDESAGRLLPEPWERIDRDQDGVATLEELTAACDRQLDQLPNLVVPDMGGGGALEICVATAAGVCDFISAMDTPRIGEWNTWYHLLNCGYPLKVAGETDFPCMSSRNVGQGRSYVRLGNIERIDFTDWCNGLAKGNSYCSDGYAHALEFSVNGEAPGGAAVQLAAPETVRIEALVAFAPEIPKAVAHGALPPQVQRRQSGDTVVLHGPRSEEWLVGGERIVELVVNGHVLQSKNVPADGRPHAVRFDVPISRSSWVAVRQFPQLHTNPVDVLVAGRPIRASRDSARWCVETVRALWDVRHTMISEAERPAARAAYDDAIRQFEQIAAEAE